MKTYVDYPVPIDQLQELLCLHGYGLVLTGVNDAATKRAVCEFQESCGIEQTGSIGEIDFSHLQRPLASIAGLGDRAYPLDPTFAAVIPWLALRHLDASPREIGGDNQGPWVRLFANGHDGPKWYWCAWWASYVYLQAYDIVTTLGGKPDYKRELFRSGYCPTMQTRARSKGRLLTQEEARDDPSRVRPGMMCLVHSTKKKRVAHVGVVIDGGRPDHTFVTVEGNTNDDGGRNGVEVARRIRIVDGCDFVDLEA